MPEATVLIEDVVRKKTGWFDIQTDELGKLGTRDKDLATEARDLIDQRARITYNEKEDGEYTNRYLQKILGPASSNGSSAPTAGEKDIRIMRQTASKVAAFLAPHLPEEERTPEGLVALAEFWLDYYINGVAEPADVDDPDDDIPW